MNQRYRSLIAALLATLLVAGPGCSFVFVSGPSRETTNTFPSCSPTPTAVVADVVLTILAGISFVSVVGEDNGDGSGPLLSAGLTALFASSAGYGLIASSRCSRARERYEANERVESRRKSRVEPPAVLPDGTDGGPCFANQTCMEGLHCDRASARCLPGAPGGAGAPCAAAGDCADGQLCTDGLCTLPAVPECAHDAHCPEGSRCASGRCEAIPGSEAAPAPAPL